MAIYELDGVSPQLDAEDIWIAPDAQVIGKVTLAPKVGIWFGAVLRGDNEMISVGEGTNIQELTMVHTDPGFPAVIGQNCTIGHSAIIHGCRIGNNSLIGMGATVLNGAKIGENCLIGAGALVTEGKDIPAGSLVLGVPAKPVRQLSEGQIAGLKASALAYQANAARFKSGLKKLPD